MKFYGLIFMMFLLSCNGGRSLGQQNITGIEDCAGVIEGNSEEDLCGVCGGDNSLCSESWPVYFNSSQSIGGFQFGIEEVIILNASGGVASASGFSVSNGNKSVLGFTFDGSVIPPESGNILTLDHNSINAHIHSEHALNEGYSIRCIKD